MPSFRGFILHPSYRVESGVPVLQLFGRLEDGRGFLVRDRRPPHASGHPDLRGRRALRDAPLDRPRRPRLRGDPRRGPRGPGGWRRLRGPGALSRRLDAAPARAFARHRDRSRGAPTARDRPARLRRVGGPAADVAGPGVSGRRATLRDAARPAPGLLLPCPRAGPRRAHGLERRGLRPSRARPDRRAPSPSCCCSASTSTTFPARGSSSRFSDLPRWRFGYASAARNRLAGSTRTPPSTKSRLPSSTTW